MEQIHDVGVSTLVPYEKNARQGDVATLMESLEVNGQYRPIVVRRGTNEILAGNHTWKAAVELGWATVKVAFVDVDDEGARRIVLVDNRSNDLATYDDKALTALLSELQGFAGTGYDQTDLDTLLASLTGADDEPALTDVDDVPDVPETAQSVLGDVWSLGRHRLLVGDATGDLEPLMQGDTADLVLTDPPYNVAYVGKRTERDAIENDKLLDTDFETLLTGAFGQAASVSVPGVPIYIFHSESQRIAFETSATNVGWSIRQTLIWAKDSFVIGRQDYHAKHEPILYGWLSGAAHRWLSDRKQASVIEFARPYKSALHPTMKPVGLLAYLIGNSSKRGDIVLDLFGGSGSTLIACHAEGRTARLVELDPRYADVILRRYLEHTGDYPTNQHGHKFNG